MQHTTMLAAVFTILVAANEMSSMPPTPPAKTPYTVYPLPQSRPAPHYASPYVGMRASGSHKAIGGSGLIEGKPR